MKAYIGAYIEDRVKKALKDASRRDSVSMSNLVEQLICEGLKIPFESSAGSRHAGRKPARKIRLTREFRDKIRLWTGTQQQLCEQTGFRNPKQIQELLRQTTITPLRLQRLHRLAALVGYEGKLYEGH